MHKDEDLLRLIEEFGGYRRPKWRRPMAMVLLLVLLVWLSSKAFGATVTLAWNPNPEADVTGYKLSWGTASRTYTSSKIVNGRDTVATTVDNLNGGTAYYFAVQAFNTVGLYSDFSAEVSYTTAADTLLPSIVYASPDWSAQYPASNAIDGDKNTLWASLGEEVPNVLTVDLKTAQWIKGLIYTPRQDAWDNGHIGDYEVLVSMDGVNFTAVASGEFTTLNKADKAILFRATQARYYKLVVNSAIGGGGHITIGELAVIATTEPSVTVTVDSSTDLRNWTERSNFTNPALDKEFYRLRVTVDGRTIVKIIELQTAPPP